MSKKHYEAIAKILREMDADPEAHYRSVAGYKRKLIRQLAVLFEDDNPNFSFPRFLAACSAKKA